MIAAVGHFALATALAVSLIQFVVPLWGLRSRNTASLVLALPAARASFVLILCAFCLLTVAFLQDDFSLSYVANQSNSALPLIYKISAVWGGHEGSLLLWLLMLTGWGLAVASRSRKLPLEISATVLAVIAGVTVGFLLFVLFTSNPFERLLPAPLEGRDLNPLLQDPGLAIHPPMLYMGYVGFTVPFAFAIAALLHGRLDTAWLRWTRPWATWAWSYLTLGIMLGSWWAYNELGWGGWWFWDPVENASFMPWLVGTALIHSLAATEKRRVLASWTILLAIAAFALSLLGTFLVRSGVLVSVHAFATDPARGVYILGFFSVVVGGSLALYTWRAASMSLQAPIRLNSREGLLLVNNVLLVVAAFSVLLGTLYPLMVDALGLPKPSVGPPWFNATFVPLMLPMLALVGFSWRVNWWKADWGAAVRANRVAMLVALVGGLALPLMTPDVRGVGIFVACVLAMWCTVTALAEIFAWLRKGRLPPASILGMSVAHLGLGIFAIGVGLVSQADAEKDLAMRPGQQVTFGGYEWLFKGTDHLEGPNYSAEHGVIEIRDSHGRQLTVLEPEKRRYHSQPNNPMTESAIDIGLFRDLYVSLGEPLGEDAWSVRLYVKPFIRWIWFGAILMAVGGGVAATDRRYRMERKLQASASTAELGAAA
ncbi:cytochrome c-type biogenesis protein CcmF [Oceanococcus atlanticus]|uniref:Cytochrome c-type biogenesis protein CcmF n=1 Tax=Oceanococcus atlanticus TaxID=1317117 RepID=A0A1Y1SCE6_9GAMM|nr:heme lyase CcmF/NrfE family subunit [Oceanococcus atlanticus]ORE86291.1 cytochrome c-type biogenesis protein CcmF [Oceanococcus atlanticus]